MATRHTTVAETKKTTAPQQDHPSARMLLEQYECGPVAFSGTPNASYERRLVLDHVVRPEQSDPRQRFEAVAWALRDLLSQRWLKTDATYDRANPKQVYYLSMEFLIGRSLANNVLNLRVEPVVREAMEREKLDWAQLVETEPDAGLGNGGLGRLAACFLDSMATLAAPGDRLRPAVRVRDLPPGDRRRPAGRAPRPLAPPSRPLGGHPAEGGRGGRVELRLPVEGGEARSGPGRADDPRRHALRPAGRRLRRPDHQHAAALGRGDAPGLQLPGVQPRRLLRRRPREGRGRVAHAGPLPRRLDAPRQRLAVRAGVFPGRLLAGRHRGAVPPPRQRLARAARQGRDPAQRHPPGAGRRRADAHPAGSGPAGLGRSVGPDRPDPGLHQPHVVARGAGDLADRPLRDRPAPAPRDHLRGQPPLPGRRACAPSRRRGPRPRASA